MSNYQIEVEFYKKAARQQAPVVVFRCFFTDTSQSSTPTTPALEIRRFLKGKPDKKVKVLVVQGGPDFASLWADNVVDGVLAFKLNAPPTVQGLARYWEFFIATSPLSPKSRLEVWAGATTVTDLVFAADDMALKPPQMNSPQPASVQLVPTQFPRLSVGLNQVVPPVNIGDYRGSKAGSGDANSITPGSVTGEALQALLHLASHLCTPRQPRDTRSSLEAAVSRLRDPLLDRILLRPTAC